MEKSIDELLVEIMHNDMDMTIQKQLLRTWAYDIVYEWKPTDETLKIMSIKIK